MAFEEQYWRPLVKLQIARRVKFIGPGCLELLQGIRECGSVRQASEKMGLSYSKAWHILNTLDGEVGFPVLERKQGGRSGGETRLSPEGERLMCRYEAFDRECRQAVCEIFNSHFSKEARPMHETD